MNVQGLHAALMPYHGIMVTTKGFREVGNPQPDVYREVEFAPGSKLHIRANTGDTTVSVLIDHRVYRIHIVDSENKFTVRGELEGLNMIFGFYNTESGYLEGPTLIFKYPLRLRDVTAEDIEARLKGAKDSLQGRDLTWISKIIYLTTAL